MEQSTLNFIFIGITFAIYIGIALRSRAASTKEYYTAGACLLIRKWYGHRGRLDVGGDLYLNGWGDCDYGV